MKRVVFVLSLPFLLCYCAGEDSRNDALYQKAKETDNLTAKTALIHKYVDLGTKNLDRAAISKGQFFLGYLYEQQGITDSALFYYSSSLQFAIEARLDSLIYRSSMGVGSILWVSGMHEKAHASYQQAYRNSHNANAKIWSLIGLISTANQTGKADSAKVYLGEMQTYSLEEYNRGFFELQKSNYNLRFGDKVKAEESAQRLVEMIEQGIVAENEFYHVYENLGDLESANPLVSADFYKKAWNLSEGNLVSALLSWYRLGTENPSIDEIEPLSLAFECNVTNASGRNVGSLVTLLNEYQNFAFDTNDRILFNAIQGKIKALTTYQSSLAELEQLENSKLESALLSAQLTWKKGWDDWINQLIQLAILAIVGVFLLITGYFHFYRKKAKSAKRSITTTPPKSLSRKIDF